jgi:peptidyl-prolyl cis-trans isomerase SurA
VRSETSFSAYCGRLATAAFAGALLLALPTAASAQQVVAFVNGQPITNLDIVHRAKFLQMTTKKVPSRKEVMDSIIDEILEIVEAKRYGLEVPDDQVNDSYRLVATRMGLDADKLTQVLTAGGASADTLKRRLRAQVAWANLVRGRFKASLEIRDKDVEAQMQLHKPDEKNELGYEYIMRPVIFIVQRGSAEAAFEARKREAEALRSRFQNCAEGVTFARALPDVAVRDQVSKFSSDLAPQLRQILDGTAVGHLTPPEQTAEGIQLFAICGKRETKSETPEMKEIRESMFQQKFGAQAKRYLETLRRQAMIEYKVPEAKLRDQKDQKDQK